jgi:uncharacterized protein (TIGR03435 family)
MRIRRRFSIALLTLSAILTFPLQHLLAQAPAAERPEFEVATIKPSEAPTPGQFRRTQVRFGMQVDAARVNIQFMSLMEIIAAAYRVKPYQVSGPDWLTMERFDITAKIPDGVSPDLVPEMLQSLLAERFKLAVHRDKKEHAVYALVVGKNGPKLKEAAPDADAPPAANGDAAPPPSNSTGPGQMQIGRDKGGLVISGSRAGTMRMSMNPGGTMRMEGSKMTAPVLADMISRFVDRPVVDMTGLTGTYDVTLDLSMEDMRFAARNAGMPAPGGGRGGSGDLTRSPAESASDPSGGSIFTAVQALGLKLDPRKAPLESITIDHVEKTPTEN